MTEDAAVFRAALASALRSLPSELGRARPPRGPLARHAMASVRGLAIQLECASPGLALMLQLRARIFEQAARAAQTRGFDQVVTVGWGFARRRLHGRCPRLVTIEHPAVLEADADAEYHPPRMIRVPARDFTREGWAALSTRALCRDRKTLFLVEGLSLWGSEAALSYWLSHVADGAAPGSELVLNVLDRDAAAEARGAVEHADGDIGGWCAFRFGLDRQHLASEVEARGLVLLHLFDSREIQSTYLGVATLFVRELYGWARVPACRSTALSHRVPAARRSTGSGGRPTGRFLRPSPLRELVRSAPPAGGAYATCMRPLLVPGVEVRDDGETTVHLVRPVTPLRACVAALRRHELAAISSFDGSLAVPDLQARLARDGLRSAAHAVPHLASALAAHGFLAEPPGATSSLAGLREAAFTALQERDLAAARCASRSLAPFADNPSVAHLRSVLRMMRDVAFARDGEIAVVGSVTMMRGAVSEMARVARTFLQAIARVLGVRFDGHVLIDVSSTRPALPVTVVSEADPHTLVYIPLPSYCRSLVCHELTHVLAMSSSAWLSEGLAVWMQKLIAPGACFPDDAAASGSGVVEVPLARRLFDDAALFPRSRFDSGAARAAYRQAAAFVAWMISRFGMGRFTGFFAALRFRDDGDVVAACHAVGVGSLNDLETEWRRRS